jgi:hypothetical protein
MHEIERLQRRVRVASLLTGVLFAALSARAAALHLSSAPVATTRAALRRSSPPRGRIYAANGDVLARNRDAWELDADPSRLASSPEVLARLVPFVGGDRAVLDALVTREARRGTRVLRLVRPVAEAHVAALRVALRGVRSAWLTPVIEREYTVPSLAEAVGTMGDVDRNDLAEPHGYRLGDTRGLSGIERSWELTLRGFSVDPTRREALDVFTALDPRLDAAVTSTATHGVLIVLDPRDGSLRLLRRWPVTDVRSTERAQPALLDTRLPAPAVVAMLATAHRVAHGASPPLPTPHTPLAVFEQSPQVWPPIEQEYHLQEPTGIDLRDEVVGLPTQGSPAAVPSITTLQAAVSYAAMFNGGVRYAPRLVARVQRANGAIMSRNLPIVRGNVAATDASRAAMRTLLRETLTAERAAAHAVGVEVRDCCDAGGVRAAVTLADGTPVEWFIGVAPLDAPTAVVALTLAHGRPYEALRIGTQLLSSARTTPTTEAGAR